MWRSKEPFICPPNLKIHLAIGATQRGRCSFCDACPNRKMYLEIRCANERAFTVPRIIDQFGRKSNQKKRKEVDYKISFSTYVCYTPDGLF